MHEAESLSSSEPIGHVLKEHNVLGDLEALVSAGCDRAFLVSRLDALRFQNPQFNETTYWTGKERRTLQALQKRLANSAEHIETLNRTLFKLLLVETGRADLLTLPEDLLRYNQAIEDVLRNVSPRRRLYRQITLAGIVQHVLERTQGNAHDPKVAALVGAVEDTEYSTDAQRQWRTDYYDKFVRLLKPSTP